MTTSDPITPDAVEQAIANLDNVLVSECSHTLETASALDVCIGNLRHAHRAERARHAEEVARLEERLAGSCEAEELRSGLEKLMADRGPRGTDAVSRDSLQALLDKVDARDSLLTLETIDSLRDQLRRAERERDAERKHATEMEERALDLVRDLRLAQVELVSLRSLLPDVRACAEYLVEPVSCLPSGLRQSARNILAALDSQGGEGE